MFNKFVYIITITSAICLYNCNNFGKTHNKKQKIVKICKIYSSDFEVLDTTLPGQLIQEYYFNRDGYVRELIRYGSQGEVIGRFKIDGTDSPFPQPVNPLVTDTVITSKNYSKNGILRDIEIKHYNSKGLIEEICYYDTANNITKRNTFKYNNYGYIIEDIYWDIELEIPAQVIRYKYEYYPN